MKQLTNC